MSAPDIANDFILDLIRSASANGWTVVNFELRQPGYIVLSDHNGTEVRIDSPHGLDLPFYIEQFKARPRP